jgi:hypothetical protein
MLLQDACKLCVHVMCCRVGLVCACHVFTSTATILTLVLSLPYLLFCRCTACLSYRCYCTARKQALNLRGCSRVSGACMQHLSCLTGITDLCLLHNPRLAVDDACVAAVARLPSIKILGLGNHQVGVDLEQVLFGTADCVGAGASNRRSCRNTTPHEVTGNSRPCCGMSGRL